MNGPHDMGGMHCFGPVKPEHDEPLFHADWEKRAMALTVAMGFTGAWNIDVSRHARESLRPDFYLTSSYYKIWLAGLEKLMLQRDMVTARELENGQMETPARSVNRVLAASEVGKALAKGGPVDRQASSSPGFQVGDSVRTKNLNPAGHTRLPAYARDKTGRVVSIHGVHVFPDTNAKGEGECPAWLYSVAFGAQTLFGNGVGIDDLVMLDCWEPYLELA